MRFRYSEIKMAKQVANSRELDQTLPSVVSDLICTVF